jgi:hypothetical protein
MNPPVTPLWVDVVGTADDDPAEHAARLKSDAASAAIAT